MVPPLVDESLLVENKVRQRAEWGMRPQAPRPKGYVETKPA